MSKHCWHQIGHVWPMDILDGCEDVKCCHCGTVAVRYWKPRWEQVADHGAHYKTVTRDYYFGQDLPTLCPRR